jgi:flagellar basal body-associated protein FliL
MSASNPYAASSPRGYDAPKKKRNKWLWIGLPILLLIIIGAVLGGVLGTQLNKDSSSSSSSGGSKDSTANTGVPSGVTAINTATSTGANGQAYLAVATDSYTLPVYATGVSFLTLPLADAES